MFIPSGSTFNPIDVDATNGVFETLKVQNENVSPFGGFRNLIINGNKKVNQSGLTNTDNAYNYDNHYKVGNNWFMFIDGKNIVSGKPYTLSWDGIATAGYYIGTAGALTINAQTFTTISKGDTINPTITSSQILWFKFASDASGSTYNNVQFEQGTVPTPYEQRLYELEENLVQTCYERGYFKHWATASGGGQALGGTLKYSKEKRINPIVSSAGLATVNCSGVFASESNIYSLVTYAVSTAVGSVSFNYSWFADARPY